MEYVKGESLMTLVRREGKLDPERAVGYILQAGPARASSMATIGA